MRLEQKDKDMLIIFLNAQYKWMKENSLNDVNNLIILKEKTNHFMKEENQTKNLAFTTLISLLEGEIIKRELRKEHHKRYQKELIYYPIVKPYCDNTVILKWINEVRSVCIDSSYIEDLNYSIKEKIRQNAIERGEAIEIILGYQYIKGK